MIVNEKDFVRKYSLIYTIIISIILLAPMSIYIKHKINIHEIQTQIKLEYIQSKIIDKMEQFGDQPNEYFDFPKYNNYESALYKNNFHSIYTQINDPLISFIPGYFKYESTRYLIQELPNKKYFGAKFLVTKYTISFVDLYFEFAIIIFGIMFIILLLSIYFLNTFSKPFKRVNEKLDLFIKDSMHEINTPLSVINLNIDLFSSINGDNKYLARMKAATKSLSTIYNDMDFLIKQNKLVYEKELINLYDFLQERIVYFELICEVKEISLNLNITDKNLHIFFNPIKLQRVVDNTLSNAIKFSYRNNDININIENIGKDIILSFEDFGQGIEDVEKITQRYYRENKEKNGFGIGMNIVKSIINEDNVQLNIKSQLKKGSTFSYTFKKNL